MHLMEEEITREGNENRGLDITGILYKNKFCASANSKVSLLCLLRGGWVVLCAVCRMSALVHRRCSGVHRSLTKVKDFAGRECIPGVLFGDEDEVVNLDGDNVEVV